ncbi:MAG: CCA tRNA nucleotidyltransferase, partial [Burkholderiaceae bacterium]|nr:CCA tRNA nucleotidyltransferase [Burkholderiaceae bacterium]
MITKFLDRLLRRGPRPKSDQSGATLVAHKVSKKSHQINPALLSKNAVKVTHTLQQAGYKAYIVGGAVRDLVLGIAPKDFDVATNATPEQVQKLFRRSRLIGRRFQIVHVTYFGKDRPEIIEVSTFRAVLESVGEHIAESGRILRDNVWGTHAEDAARRDFTINAIAQEINLDGEMIGPLIDPCGGQKDLDQRVIRHVSNAFNEDPLRILRLARFMARLDDFHIHPSTLDLVKQMVHDGELKYLVPERVWQELSRGLLEIKPSRMLDVLMQTHASSVVFPRGLDQTHNLNLTKGYLDK